MKSLIALALLSSALVIPSAGWAEGPFEGRGPVAMGEGPAPMMMGGDRMGPDSDGPRDHAEGPRGMMKHHDPLEIATRLNAIETAIGIQAEQLDVWRAYTSAVIDMVTPPAFDDMKGKGKDKAKDDAKDEAKKADPFERELMMAKITIERAKKAEALTKAIEAVRAKLTPAQLEQFAALSHEGRGGERGGFDRKGPEGDRDHGDRDGRGDRPERD